VSARPATVAKPEVSIDDLDLDLSWASRNLVKILTNS
jgi:hypothetical protein